MRVKRYLADLDAATAYVSALARHLRGEDARVAGAARWRRQGWFERAVGALPERWRQRLSSEARIRGAVPTRSLQKVRAERLSRWASGRYPRQRYPAIAVGSASGALVHLFAAMGVPWVPQTFLVRVRPPGTLESPISALECGEKLAPKLLKYNAELMLHQVHDPGQQTVNFRLKRLRLGAEYGKFIRGTLRPGGTIFVVECRRAWPVTRLGPRHVFQLGGLGSPGAEELVEGVSDVVAPVPTEMAPEAQWGFAPSLLDDVEFFARRHGYRVARVIFDEPDDPSDLVADLYAWWYRLRQLDPSRLVVEASVQVDPFAILKAAAVPFWLKSNLEEDADRLEEFLATRDAWSRIQLAMSARELEPSGAAPEERWRELWDRAHEEGGFISFRQLGGSEPMAEPITLEQLERFLADHGAGYPVRWIAGKGVKSPVRAREAVTST